MATPRASPTPEAIRLLGDASFLDALPSQIAVVDRHLGVRVANRAWHESHRGQHYLDAWAAAAAPTDDLRDRVTHGVEAVLAGPLTEYVEEYAVWRPEGARWVLLRAAPFASRGERLALVALVDITARKVAERFSQVQHEILSMVTADVPLGATLERLALAVQGEAPGTSCTVHTVSSDGAELALAASASLPEAVATGLARVPLGTFGSSQTASVLQLTALEHLDGIAAARQHGYRQAAWAPVRTQGGANLGGIVLWFDGRQQPDRRALELLDMAAPLAAVALERYHTTWELRERETRLQSVFALHPDAVLILDPAGGVQSLNPAAEQLLAETPGDFVGRPFDQLIPANLRSRFAERLRRALTGYPQRFTISVHPRGRSRVDADMTFVPLLSGGNVGGIYVVAKDITEQLEAAEQLKQSGQQLQQSVKMEAVGRLAGGIAHDFNNLLTAIRGYTDLLIADDAIRDGAGSDLMEISRAVDRASSLTRQLLAFSRQQVVQRKLVDLNAVVDEVRSMLTRLLREDTELVVRAHDEPLWVLADAAQVHQVIMNLVVNAQDAMPAGGKLAIETAQVVVEPETTTLTPLEPGSYATVSVADTGRGMDQETQAHIFEPFFTTKPPGQGTGLGLSTVYAIVEQTGARIGFESAVDQGTSFAIYFREQAEGADEPDRARGDTGVRHGSETVLLVEDDEPVRRMVRKILTAAGYTVLEARHGADALIVSREFAGPIDLLLTDVVMPELNGLRLAHLLKQERPDTEVVFMSGYARDEVDRQGLKEPGVLFIHKPFTVAELSDAVRTALDPANSTAQTSD